MARHVHWKSPQRLRLLSFRLVFVIRMLLHVSLSQPFGLVDVRSFLLVSQALPLRAKPLADLGVVHLWIFISNLLSHFPGPDHEGVHRSFYLVVVFFTTVWRGASMIWWRELHRQWMSSYWMAYRVTIVAVCWWVAIRERHYMHHERRCSEKETVGKGS